VLPIIDIQLRSLVGDHITPWHFLVSERMIGLHFFLCGGDVILWYSLVGWRKIRLHLLVDHPVKFSCFDGPD
jgi:hypothetical protein